MAHIEKRPGNSWLIVISDGYDEHGKKKRLQRTVRVDPTKTENAQRSEVKKIAAAMETDLARNKYTLGKLVTLSQIADDYLDSRKRRGLAPRTLEDYEKIINKRIVPFFGKMHIQDIRPTDINRFLRSMQKEGISGTTQLKYWQQLHEILQYAVFSGHIAMNPCDQTEAPRKDTGETQFYELDDCVRLLDALEDYKNINVKFALFFTMLLYTGMRPGELIGLDWSDITGSVLTVRAGFVQLKGETSKRTDRPKTKHSVRMIDLPPEVTTLLEEHRIEQMQFKFKYGKGFPEPDAVFTNEDGYRLGKTAPSHLWHDLLEKYNLKPIRLYGLRHTAATLMIAQGLNVRDVAARLGHAQATTTLNVYAHAFMDANSRATAAIATALENAKTAAQEKAKKDAG